MGRKIICLLLLFFFLSPGIAWAQETPEETTEQNLQSQMEASGAQDLAEQAPDEAKEILEQLDLQQLDYRQLLSLTPAQLWQVCKSALSQTIRAPLLLLGTLIAIILLCAAMDALKVGFNAQGLDKVFSGVAVLCLVTAVLEPVTSCIQKTSQAILQGSQFMNGFIPVFCGILTAGGQPVSAGVYHLLLFGTSQVVGQAASQILVPLIGIFLAFCFTAAIAPELHLDQIGKTVKKFVNGALGLLLTVYVGLLGVQSMVAVSADTVTVKTAKFVTSSFVPVIGSALSDALVTAQACLKLLKTSVGAYGIFIAAFTFLPLLAEIICWYLAMQAAALVGRLVSAGTLSKVLEGTASALGLLMSITLLFGLLFIISTTVMLVVGMGG